MGFKSSFLHILVTGNKSFVANSKLYKTGYSLKNLGRRCRQAALSAAPDFTAWWIKKKSEVWQILHFSKNAALISGLLRDHDAHQHWSVV